MKYGMRRDARDGMRDARDGMRDTQYGTMRDGTLLPYPIHQPIK